MDGPYGLFGVQRDPSDDDSQFNWSIVRAVPGQLLKLVVLAPEWFGIRTHYFRGRTTPHLTVNCEACATGQLSRWHGYLQAVRAGGTEKVILEYTAAAHDAVRCAFEASGGLRGMNLIASRATNKANGKVRLQFVSMSQSIGRLPPCDDYWSILSHIWGLNQRASHSIHDASPDDLSSYEKDGFGHTDGRTPGQDQGESFAA